MLTRPGALVLVRRLDVRLEMRGREEERLADGAAVLLLHARPRGTRRSGGRRLRRPWRRETVFIFSVALSFLVQSGAARHLQGFEDKNLGSSPVLLGQ